MAGDWIKMELDLAEKPEVMQIADALLVDKTHVVGLLHRCWTWFNRYTTDGHAQNVTLSQLDAHVGVQGFAQAMLSTSPTPWLIHENGLKIPNFDRHNGESAKKRFKETERKQRYRASLGSGHADVTTLSRARPEKNGTKRREDISKPKGLDKGASAFELPTWVPREPWDHFVVMRREIKRPMTPAAMAEIVLALDKLRLQGHHPATVLLHSVKNSYPDVYAPKKTTQDFQRRAWTDWKTNAQSRAAMAAEMGVDIEGMTDEKAVSVLDMHFADLEVNQP